MNRKVLFLAVTTAALVGCTTIGAEETVGQRFRKVMAEIDTQCKKDKLGPYLDPSDPEYRTKRNQTDCDILKLKPVDPLATPEGRFAHSLKLPPPHDKPKDVYKSGMTGEEYFKALCAAEAGEWMFRSAERVEGFMLMRPWPPSSNISLLGQYYENDETMALDDFAVGPRAQGYIVSPTIGHYQFLERPVTGPSEAGKYVRFYRDTKQPLNNEPYGVSQSIVAERLSRYGYTWRGIERPHAREHGISGAETIVVDLQTQEILGYRRVFRRVYFNRADADPRLMWPTPCSKIIKDGAVRNRGVAFIEKILKPASN